MSNKDERADRLKKVLLQMDEIIRKIGPEWIKLAHLRKEAELITAELDVPVD